MTKHLDKTPGAKSQPQEPRSYVVRVYRSSRESMVGQVEDVQTGVIRTFRSKMELWAAISGNAAGTITGEEGVQT